MDAIKISIGYFNYFFFAVVPMGLYDWLVRDCSYKHADGNAYMFWFETKKNTNAYQMTCATHTIVLKVVDTTSDLCCIWASSKYIPKQKWLTCFYIISNIWIVYEKYDHIWEMRIDSDALGQHSARLGMHSSIIDLICAFKREK